MINKTFYSFLIINNVPNIYLYFYLSLYTFASALFHNNPNNNNYENKNDANIYMTWPVLKLVIKPLNWFNWRTTEPAVKQYLGSPYCRTSYLQ